MEELQKTPKETICKTEIRERLLQKELAFLLRTLSKEKRAFKAKKTRGKELDKELLSQEDQLPSSEILIFYIDYIDRFISDYRAQMERIKGLKEKIDDKIFELAKIRSYRRIKSKDKDLKISKNEIEATKEDKIAEISGKDEYLSEKVLTH